LRPSGCAGLADCHHARFAAFGLIFGPTAHELPKAEWRLPRPALTQAEAELVLAQPDLADPVPLQN